MLNMKSVTRPLPVVAACATIILLPTSSVHADSECAPEWIAGIGQPGMSQSVQASHIFDDGAGSGPVLYVGGAFTSAGGDPAERVARWDGVSWNPVGAGLNGAVRDLIGFDIGSGFSLFATGDFTQSGGTNMNHVARWTGSDWQPVGSGLGGSGNAMAVFDDGNGERVYIGGNFTSNGDGTLVRRIAVWDGVRWKEAAGGVLGSGSSVQALAVFDDGNGPALYIAGHFGFVGGNNPFNNIVRWDGEELTALGEGVSGGSGGNVLAMEVFDDGTGPALYVGGVFTTAGGQPIGKLARWDGRSWSAVGGDVSAGLLGVQDIAADHEAGKLYITGQISSAGGTFVNNIAVWDGDSWSGLGTGLTGGVIPAGNTMTIGDTGDGRSLYVGGIFTTAGGISAARIAELALPAPPAILEQPEDVLAEYGENVSLTVSASGAKEYQWRRDGVDLTDGNGISGATTSELQLQSVTLDDAGLYDVVVINGCGEVVSDSAELTVEPKLGDLNGDGVVNGADLLILLSAWGTCSDPDDCPADLNGDGQVNGGDFLLLLGNWG